MTEDLNELNSLGCPLWAEIELEETLNWMCQDTLIYINKETYSFEPSSNLYPRTFPRFGIYSTLLKNISVFIFNDPILEKKLGDTACTDGVNIFINLNFYKKLTELEDLDPEERMGVIPVILHEIDHIIDNDVFRYPNVSHEVANIASDIHNNAYIKQSFKNIKWLPYLMDLGYGLKAGDEHYAMQSTETVLIDVLNKIEKNVSPEISEIEKQRINDPKIYIPEELGRSIDYVDEKILKNKKHEKHVISLEDLLSALNEAELPHVAKALGLDVNDPEKSIKDLHTNAQKIIENSLDEISNIQKQAGLNSQNSPSGKTIGNIKEQIALKKQARLTWQKKIINEVWGEGGKEKYNYDQPNDMFYVDEIKDMIGFDFYEGSTSKVKSDDLILIILDTSGSMSKDALSSALTEIINLQKEAINDVFAKKMIVVFADTDIKSDRIIVLDEDNYQSFIDKKYIEIEGRGGTNLKKSINNSLSLKILEGETISSLIVFTDLLDTPPLKSEIKRNISQENASFTYISVNPEPILLTQFRKKVSDYADVIAMDEGRKQEIVLTNEPKNKPKKNRLKM